jgi:hypothetical protein
MQVSESIFLEKILGTLQIDDVFVSLACALNYPRDCQVSARRSCVLIRARSRQELRDEVRTHDGRGQDHGEAHTEAGAVSDGLLHCLLNSHEEGRPPHDNVCVQESIRHASLHFDRLAVFCRAGFVVVGDVPLIGKKEK